MTKKQTKEIMLQDFIDQFVVNPDSISTDSIGNCAYYPADREKSPGCAIGMYLSDDVAKKLDNLVAGDITDIFEDGLDYLLPKWMVNVGEVFLEDFQALHDYSNNRTIFNDIYAICEKYNLDFNSLKFPKCIT